jgi:spermidine synthase
VNDGGRRRYATAFLAGMTSLSLELLLVRMLAFFLTSAADFLAIPLALLGLALGSMYAHFVYRGTPERLVSLAGAAVLPLVTASLVVLFAVFDLFFFRVHVALADVVVDSGRLLVYSAVLLPPFAAFGALFAGLFARDPDDLGRMYAADLGGAAVGCVVAPILLTYAGLPAALVGVVFCALLLLFVDPGRSLVARVAGGALFAAVAVGAGTGVLFAEHPDSLALAHAVLGRSPDAPTVSPVDLRWNEIARTAVLRVDQGGGSNFYVVQDNGLSNVTLQRWPPSPAQVQFGYHSLAWKLGRDPKEILVMFAGAGRDMMDFDRLSDGKADVVGVELNPAVVAEAKAVHGLNIDQFLARPNDHLVVQEGRDFLNHDQRKYDVIYVANNGAVYANRTGHTRKFLDTREAMTQYLDHLAPGGLLLFINQPVAEKITSFEALFQQRGLGPFEHAAFVFGPPNVRELQTLIVSPSGFDPADAKTMAAEAQRGGFQVLYSPFRANTRLTALATTRKVTDDLPFTRGLELSGLQLDPRARRHNLAFVSSWVKVFTVALFAVISAVASLAVLRVGHGPSRVPAAWILYLALTGIGYMCAEIGLIARTELFVGNPLYAVAINLAVFLVSSAAGSFLSERLKGGPLVLASLAVSGIAWGIATTTLLDHYALSIPLFLKVGGVALAVGPAGAALGAFYPHAVSELVKEGRGTAIPGTYALTTLSSVMGSAFATTAILELGFSRIIGLGAIAYVLAGAVAWSRESRRVGSSHGARAVLDRAP